MELETLVIAWTLVQVGSIMPVVGFTRSEQMKPIFAALNVAVAGNLLDELERAYCEMNMRTRDRVRAEP